MVRDYDWPRTGTPLSNVVVMTNEITADEFMTGWTAAQHGKRYLGGWVYRDPELTPHTPSRAMPNRAAPRRATQ